MSQEVIESENSNTFAVQKSFLLKTLKRRIKHAVRRLAACEQELEQSRRWERVYHQGLLLQANLFKITKGMKEVIVSDWLDGYRETCIHLNPLLEPHLQVASLFRLSRKQKAAIPHLEKQVELRHRHCLELGLQQRLLESVENEGALQAWTAAYVEDRSFAPSVVGKKKAVALPYQEFVSAAGLLIRVGRGAKSNELLTFVHSKGSDWWLHVRDFPGSHVVLVVPKGKSPDEESIQDALFLALTHSKARAEREAEVVITQCKFVHRLKGGRPGKVSLGKHQVRVAVQDAERLKRLRPLTALKSSCALLKRK